MTSGSDAVAARAVATAAGLGRDRRPLIVASIGLVALAVAVLAAVGLGSVAGAPGDTLGILAHRLLGLDLARTWSPPAGTVVWGLGVPRVLEAPIGGLRPAGAGATVPGIPRNPPP